MSRVYKTNETKATKRYKFGTNLRVGEFWRMMTDEGFLGGGEREVPFIHHL